MPTKEWREKNKEHINEYNKTWRDENKEHINEYNKQYYMKKKLTIQTKARAANKTPESIEKRKQRDKKRYENDDGRRKAVYTLNHAIRDGKIIRPHNCSRCGSVSIPHGHHEDYSKPLNVVWLCRGCHLRIHGKEIVL